MTSTDGPVKKLLQQGPQNNSVFWASLAGLLQVALAVSAGVIAYWQVTEQWAVQNEQAARDAYKDFLKISMDHPTLSGGICLTMSTPSRMTSSTSGTSR